MATIQQLIKRLNYYANDTIDTQTAIDLFNAALEDLSDVAGYGRTSTATFFSGQNMIPLPSDLVKFVEIKIQQTSMPGYLRLQNLKLVQPVDYVDSTTVDYGSDYSYANLTVNVKNFGYEWFGDQIEIRPAPSEDGTLLIRYYANLPAIPDYDVNNPDVSMKFVPAVRARFHEALPLFAAMRYAQNYKDALDEKRDYQQDYLILKKELEQDTKDRISQTESKSVYVVRRWA